MTTELSPWYSTDAVTLYHGDCLAVLREIPDASVDAVVTDPPYGLEFMGKEWDGANGFRRSLNAADAGRDSVFGRTSRTSPEYVTGKPSGARLRTRADGRTNPTEGKSSTTTPESYVAGPPFQQWCEAWARECFRVLKPGGHLLAFGGSRTWHRLSCAVEDAGFEIRDSIAWLHGQGFPKSMNLNKDARFCRCEMGESGDDQNGVERRGPTDPVRELRHGGQTFAEPGEAPEGRVLHVPVSVGGSEQQDPGSEQVRRNGDQADASLWSGQPGLEGRGDTQACEGQLQGRPVRPLPGGVPTDGPRGRLHHGAPAGHGPVGGSLPAADGSGEPQGPQTVEQCPGKPGAVPVERGSQAWRGWPVCGRCAQPAIPAGLGTALKPAFEPVVVGRKPFPSTVAANVLEHGTGALNIDACRVGAAVGNDYGRSTTRADGSRSTSHAVFGADQREVPSEANAAGRWPTNVVLDESQAAELDAQTGVSRSRVGKPRGAASGDGWGMTATGAEYDDQGGASRFFPTFRYQAKAPKSERPTYWAHVCDCEHDQPMRPGGSCLTCGTPGEKIAHPTVKPLDYMRWLVRLVTPPGGTVLEPFTGSGTTVEACVLEGFTCIAIEKEADYLPLTVNRLDRRLDPVAAIRAARADSDPDTLFDLQGEESA